MGCWNPGSDLWILNACLQWLHLTCLAAACMAPSGVSVPLMNRPAPPPSLICVILLLGTATHTGRTGGGMTPAAVRGALAAAAPSCFEEVAAGLDKGSRAPLLQLGSIRRDLGQINLMNLMDRHRGGGCPHHQGYRVHTGAQRRLSLSRYSSDSSNFRATL